MNQNSFVCTLLNGFKLFRTWLNISVWLIDGTLTGTTILGHRSGSNGKKGVFLILKAPEVEPHYHMV